MPIHDPALIALSIFAITSIVAGNAWILIALRQAAHLAGQGDVRRVGAGGGPPRNTSPGVRELAGPERGSGADR